ncbi:MAG: DnaA N-terminal domain-containing protein, partial [Planctomycetota bacterium]
MIEDLAQALRTTLQGMLAPEQYQTWFKRSKLVRVDDRCVVVAVPNAFAREWIAKYYLDPLEEAVRTILGVERRVVLKEQPESLVEENADALEEPRGREAARDSARDSARDGAASQAATTRALEPAQDGAHSLHTDGQRRDA